ncbi:MAG: hypothetical protein IT181_13135 [Acidobacteria bacterium]|nr:hypothetical protein [Acidobacteriota bacterium]
MKGPPRRAVRRPYLPPGPSAFPGGWSFGYLHPSGACPHDPPCTPSRQRCLPQPKQWLAHTSIAEILLYGGAVGGGKTEYALVEAVVYCLTHPGVHVAIFRRTYPELEASVISRFLALVPPEIAHYSSKGIATFYNGSKLWFRSCQYERDVYRFQSAQWAALFIDEAGHFTEFIVRYLYSRVRWPGVPNILRLTANPGGPGMGFLRRWFMKPLPAELGNRPLPRPFELWRPLPGPKNPTKPENMPRRQFIPALFDDNLALKQYKPDYLSQVYDLPGDKGAQLAEGNWDANDSMIVGPYWQEQRLVAATDADLIGAGLRAGQVIPWHVVPDARWKPPAGALIYGSVDYGYGAPWSFHLHAVLADGHVRTFFEFYEPKVRDVEQARRIRQVLERESWRPEWMVLDPSMWNSRKEMGIAKSIAEVYTDELGGICQLRPGAAGRSARVSRPQRWIAAMQTAPDGFPWWQVTAACPHLVRTVPDVPWDLEDPEVEDDASENHAYEDTGRFFEARPFAPLPPPPDPLAQLDAISRAHHQAMADRAKKAPGGLLGGLARR